MTRAALVWRPTRLPLDTAGSQRPPLATCPFTPAPLQRSHPLARLPPSCPLRSRSQVTLPSTLSTAPFGPRLTSLLFPSVLYSEGRPQSPCVPFPFPPPTQLPRSCQQAMPRRQAMCDSRPSAPACPHVSGARPPCICEMLSCILTVPPPYWAALLPLPDPLPLASPHTFPPLP